MTEKKIEANSGGLKIVGNAPSLILSGPKRVEVSDPDGRSNTVRTEGGDIRIQISEPFRVKAHGEPHALGFAQLWIVGPVVSRCRRLGV